MTGNRTANIKSYEDHIGYDDVQYITVFMHWTFENLYSYTNITIWKKFDEP